MASLSTLCSLSLSLLIVQGAQTVGNVPSFLLARVTAPARSGGGENGHAGLLTFRSGGQAFSGQHSVVSEFFIASTTYTGARMSERGIDFGRAEIVPSAFVCSPTCVEAGHTGCLMSPRRSLIRARDRCCCNSYQLQCPYPGAT